VVEDEGKERGSGEIKVENLVFPGVSLPDLDDELEL